MSDVGTSYGITYPGASGDANLATIQYHTPELPFATTAAIAFSTNSADGSSGNSAGGTSGDSKNEYSIQSSPVDGLTLHAQYYDFNSYDDGVAASVEDQNEEGGAYAATYAIGNATIGYGKSYKAPADTSATRVGTTTVEYVENTGMSIGYAVNDDLSVSYTSEKSEANYQTSTTTSYDIEMDSIQIAYSLGGATLSIARADVENVSYVQDSDLTETIIAMSFAF